MTEAAVPKTGLAAVIAAFNVPFEIRELPVPELAPGSLLVKVEVATVCGSDVHLWDGSLNSTRPIELPVVPGHEMVGQIVAFGEGEHIDSVGTPLTYGDRIVWTNAACGHCHNCKVTGQTNLCRNRQSHLSVNAEHPPYIVGGFAEYAYVFPNAGRVRVPYDVKSEWASAASCALRSVINGFQRLGNIEPWETVVIQGSGPLGLFATALASHAGAARIFVVGDPRARLDLALEWGATDTISVTDFPEPGDRVEAIRELTGHVGSEIVIELSGARTAFAEGLEMVRDGGRYVIVGQVGPQEATILPARLTWGQLTVLGSFSGETAQYWRALRFLSRTKDKFDFDRLISHRYHLDDATDAMHRMKSLDEIKPVVLPTLSR
jgi:L-iditol 2-dehydrogenase